MIDSIIPFVLVFLLPPYCFSKISIILGINVCIVRNFARLCLRHGRDPGTRQRSRRIKHTVESTMASFSLNFVSLWLNWSIFFLFLSLSLSLSHFLSFSLYLSILVFTYFHLQSCFSLFFLNFCSSALELGMISLSLSLSLNLYLSLYFFFLNREHERI